MKRNKIILRIGFALAIIIVGVIGIYLWQSYSLYQQGIPSLLFRLQNTYSQNETLKFGDISVRLTRKRLITDQAAGDTEVDVNFSIHNNSNDTLNLDSYHFQVVSNQKYDWVDQNSFQYGFIAPNSDIQEYFVAHMQPGYTGPFTLVVSKGEVNKSIVITKPDISAAPTNNEQSPIKWGT